MRGHRRTPLGSHPSRWRTSSLRRQTWFPRTSRTDRRSQPACECAERALRGRSCVPWRRRRHGPAPWEAPLNERRQATTPSACTGSSAPCRETAGRLIRFASTACGASGTSPSCSACAHTQECRRCRSDAASKACRAVPWKPQSTDASSRQVSSPWVTCG